MRHDSAVADAQPNGRFQTTHWSIVLAAAAGDANGSRADKAFAQFCQRYWRPIFAFVCRRGHSPQDAEDLVQDFFVKLLNGSLLSRADPARGRFRALLLKAVQNFLIDAHESRKAQKRGGEMRFVSWDEWMQDAPSHLSLPAETMESWPAERVFDVRWAASVAEQALRTLREECEARGKGRVFDALQVALANERADVSYAELAAQLNAPVATVKRLLHQLRQRYRALIRAEVRRTVDNEEELEEEIRYLCALLASAGS